MKKLRINLFRNILAIVLMIATGSAIVFAAFASLRVGSISGSTDNIIATVDFSSSSTNGACFDVEGNACSNLLSVPGNRYSIDVQVQNTSSSIRGISYDLSFVLTSDASVKDAILVYIDNIYYDTLGAITSNSTNRTATLGYLLPNQSSIAHKITFEYHIGSNLAYNTQTLKVQVKANYRAINKTEATIVSSFDDVVDGNNQVTSYGIKNIAKATSSQFYENARIVLGGNITISEDITFNQPVTIDTNGYTLTVDGGKKVTFAGIGVNRIIGNGTITGAGSIDVNNGEAILLSNKTFAGFTYTNYSLALLQEFYAQYMDEKIMGGLYQSFNFVGSSFVSYNPNATIASNSVSSLSANNTNKTITPILQQNTFLGEFSITASIAGQTQTLYTGSTSIWGTSSTSYLDSLITNELSYLQGTPTIGYNIFLPNRFMGSTSSQITWYSSAPDLISDDGQYSKPVTDQNVTLTALIVLNSYIHVIDFDVVVTGMTYAEKVKLLVGGYGDIHFDEIEETAALPTSVNYTNYTNNINLGITNITYTLDNNLYPFLAMTGSSEIKLINYTDEQYANVKLNATFGSNGTYSENINITIDVDAPEGMLDYYGIYQFIRSYFPQSDVIDNFALPRFYRTPISYWVPDSNPSNGSSVPQDLVNGIEIVNSNNAVAIVGSGSLFPTFTEDPSVFLDIQLNTNNVPMDDTTIYVIVEVGTRREVFSFVVSGVLHTAADGISIADAEIPSTILFNEIISDLLINVPTDRNYIVRKAIYDTYYRRSTALNITKTSNAQDISTLKGLQYFTFITDLRINVNSTSLALPTSSSSPNGTKVSGLNNNTFSDVTYLKNLVNLTIVQLMHASITTIESWTKLTNIETLDLRGNTNLYYIYSMEKWTGRLAVFDVRGSVNINPSDELSTHFYTFLKNLNLRKAYNNTTPTQRYNTSAVSDGSTFALSSWITNYAFGKNAKLVVERMNGVPEVMYESLLLPKLTFPEITSPSISDTYSYWSVAQGSQYISVARVADRTWAITVNQRPVEDTMIIVVVNVGTEHWLVDLFLGSSAFSMRRAYFITMKGTG